MSLQIDLSGKLALVTGGADGIGRGIAEVLIQAGASVLINDINAERGQSIADLLGAQFFHADIADEHSLIDMAAKIRALYDDIHILVNNAGIAMFAGIADTEGDDWDRLLDVDLRGVYAVTKTFLAMLETARSASVINIASVHARMTVPTMTAYAAAKGGVVSMTRSLAQELGPRGIRVNAISPGFVQTPLFQSWLDGEPNPEVSLERVLGTIPTGYIAEVQEIGALVAFLSSDYGRSINGANYVIDGGLTTRLMH